MTNSKQEQRKVFFTLSIRVQTDRKQMSKACINYLENSFLFLSEYTIDGYAKFSDNEIQRELQSYRTFVLKNIDSIKQEIDGSKNSINVVIDSFGNLPRDVDYRQMALYMNQVVIPDPLFAFAERKDRNTEVFNEFIGIGNPSKIDRKELLSTIEYIKRNHKLIKANYLKMFPVSDLHKPGEGIPLLYSKNGFSDILPKDLMRLYSDYATIHNIERVDNKLIIKVGEPLKKGTTISISFDDESRSSRFGYQYLNAKTIGDDSFHVRFTPPETIEDYEFEKWVKQSVNQAAARHFQERTLELRLAKRVGCMYLTESLFTSKILKHITTKDMNCTNADVAMKLDLPFLYNLTTEDILEIRSDYGEAFDNFRSELNTKLIELESAEDGDILAKRIKSIERELTETNLHEIEKERKKLQKTLKRDFSCAAGILIANYHLGGSMMAGAVSTVITGASNLCKYKDDIKGRNGFFIWKLNERSKKYSI